MRLWIFADFKVPTLADINLFSSCGFTDVVLGVTTDRKTFKLNYTEGRWLKACHTIRQAAMSSPNSFGNNQRRWNGRGSCSPWPASR